MKSLLCILLLSIGIPGVAQSRCSPEAFSAAAKQVTALQTELQNSPRNASENDPGTDVPPAIATLMLQFKDALTAAADAAFLCTPANAKPEDVQDRIARELHANPPQPTGNMNDPRDIEFDGSYGHNLRVEVSRPARFPNLLTVNFSINIECCDDHVLLIYEFQDGQWNRRLRWQAPKLKEISDAFGDLFLFTILSGDSKEDAKEPAWRVVVAHGTPWCTSRISHFQADLLAPSADSNSARNLWNINRSYSRGDFEDRLRSFGNTFELRINAPCMNFDVYERHVIYRYRVEDDKHIVRIGPIAGNAREFIEEWLESPWEELSHVTTSENATELQKVHDTFRSQGQLINDNQFLDHAYGPVRACAAKGTFQVQIDSTLEIIVPGKPGGDSKPLPSLYFKVRESPEGYVMVSAGNTPDPTCTGPDLMAEPKKKTN